MTTLLEHLFPKWSARRKIRRALRDRAIELGITEDELVARNLAVTMWIAQGKITEEEGRRILRASSTVFPPDETRPTMRQHRGPKLE